MCIRRRVLQRIPRDANRRDRRRRLARLRDGAGEDQEDGQDGEERGGGREGDGYLGTMSKGYEDCACSDWIWALNSAEERVYGYGYHECMRVCSTN